MTTDQDTPSENDLPRELREALDSMTSPDPTPEFRSELREKFVAGEIRCSDTTVEAALGGWKMPRASAEFRARCQTAFLGSAAEATGHAGPVPVLREPRRGRLLRFLPLVAAVAVGLFLIPELFRGGASGEHFASGPLVINGQTVSNPTAEELERLIAIPGCRVAGSGETVVFRYRNDLLVEVDPGTEFSIEEPADGSVALAIDLDKGALRISAKSEYTQQVSVRTPDGIIFMRGEALGVDVIGDSGTCLCCLVGLAEVQPSAPGASHFRVDSDDSLFIPRGTGEVRVMRGELHHRDPLVKLRQSARSYYY